MLTQHTQNRCALSTDNTLNCQNHEVLQHLVLCQHFFYTPSPSQVKNNSFLATLSTVYLPPGRSKNCECHKSDFGMARAAVAPWASQVFGFNSTAASLQTNSHRKLQHLNLKLSRTPKMARSPPTPKPCSLNHLIL